MSGPERRKFSPRKAAALRKRRGLSVEQAASEALRSVDWLRKVESGERTPTADELFDLLYALNCDSEDVSALAETSRAVHPA